MLGVSYRTLNRAADAGQVPVTWTGGGPGRGHRRYLLSDIRRAMTRGDIRLRRVLADRNGRD